MDSVLTKTKYCKFVTDTKLWTVNIWRPSVGFIGVYKGVDCSIIMSKSQYIWSAAGAAPLGYGYGYGTETYQRIAPLRAPLTQHGNPINYFPSGTHSSDSPTPDPRAEDGEP